MHHHLRLCYGCLRVPTFSFVSTARTTHHLAGPRQTITPPLLSGPPRPPTAPVCRARTHISMACSPTVSVERPDVSASIRFVLFFGAVTSWQRATFYSPKKVTPRIAIIWYVIPFPRHQPTQPNPACSAAFLLCWFMCTCICSSTIVESYPIRSAQRPFVTLFCSCTKSRQTRLDGSQVLS